MQILKDNIRQKIDKAALALFREYGYKNVSMRQIATASDMTVGNIYRYYTNKDELFCALIQPPLTAIEGLVKKDIDDNFLAGGLFNPTFDQKMIQMFLGIHRQYPDELYILIHGCEGSSLGNTIGRVSALLEEKIMLLIEIKTFVNPSLDQVFLAQLIASSIIDNYIKILFAFDDDESREIHMLHMTRMYTETYLKDIFEGRKEV